MATKPNGEPFIDTIWFGTYYMAMWRWDDDDYWTFLANKTGGRRIFESATLARSETLRIKMAERGRRVEQAGEPEIITAWRSAKAESEADERRRVFGSDNRAIVRDCAGNLVPVETKGRARA